MKVDPDGLFVVLILLAALGFFFGYVFAVYKTKWMIRGLHNEIRKLDDVEVYARAVCWYDWSDSDPDASLAIDKLREAVEEI